MRQCVTESVNAREGVCEQLSCPSGLLCLFCGGDTACGCTPRPGAAFRPGHSTLAQWYTSGWTVGEVEESRKEHDAAVTHVQCQGALSCLCAALRATGAPETLGVCAREGVCEQLSCPSSLLCLFCDGDCVWLHSQTRSGFPPGPLSSLGGV